MKNFTLEFKWASISTLIAVVWMYFEKTLGYHDTKIGAQLLFTNLFLLLQIPIYVFAMREKKRIIFNNNISWRQSFFSGLILTLLIVMFYPLVQGITYTQLSPEFFHNMINYVVSKNAMDLEAAKLYFTFNNYLSQAAFNNLSVGVVISAAVSYFIQTKKPSK